MSTGPDATTDAAGRPDRHDVETRLHREGAYDHGYFAACTCGWTSDEQRTPGLATRDGSIHLQILAPKERAA